jgi:small subunit ribosomal protein S17
MKKNNAQKTTVKVKGKSVLPRGRTFVGNVISDKMSKTVTVEWERRVYVPKYERYEKKKSRVKAHNPDEIGAKKGDVVKITETRPLSKTKNFIIVEIVGQETKKVSAKKEQTESQSEIHDDKKEDKE